MSPTYVSGVACQSSLAHWLYLFVKLTRWDRSSVCPAAVASAASASEMAMIVRLMLVHPCQRALGKLAMPAACLVPGSLRHITTEGRTPRRYTAQISVLYQRVSNIPDPRR